MGVAAVVPRGELTAERLASAVRRALGDRAVAERVPVVSARLRAQDPVQTACSLPAMPRTSSARRPATEATQARSRYLPQQSRILVQRAAASK
jgi:hypothetical protein